MKAALIFAWVIGMVFLTNAGRKCYMCEGKECENGPGKAMDCMNMACAVAYDISGSVVSKGGVKDRYCMGYDDDGTIKPEYSCSFWKGSKDEEFCICNSDLCNGEEPSCETRSIQHPEVSDVLADKCAPEIAKRKAAA